MVQLQRMDARLDTLSTELPQVNIRVGHIARWQAVMGGFTPKASPSPPPAASKAEDDDDDTSEDDDGGDASSSSIDEIST